jgi:hypothetical protein
MIKPILPRRIEKGSDAGLDRVLDPFHFCTTTTERNVPRIKTSPCRVLSPPTMLALKKKREQEKKDAEEAAKNSAAAAASGGGGAEVPPLVPPTGGTVSLFGIGGQKKTKKGDEGTGKKRSPGEIRIQRGEF